MEIGLQMASSGTSSRFRLTRMITGRFSIFSAGADVASVAVKGSFITGASIWTCVACRKGECVTGVLVLADV